MTPETILGVPAILFIILAFFVGLGAGAISPIRAWLQGLFTAKSKTDDFEPADQETSAREAPLRATPSGPSITQETPASSWPATAFTPFRSWLKEDDTKKPESEQMETAAQDVHKAEIEPRANTSTNVQIENLPRGIVNTLGDGLNGLKNARVFSTSPIAEAIKDGSVGVARGAKQQVNSAIDKLDELTLEKPRRR